MGEKYLRKNQIGKNHVEECANSYDARLPTPRLFLLGSNINSRSVDPLVIGYRSACYYSTQRIEDDTADSRFTVVDANLSIRPVGASLNYS